MARRPLWLLVLLLTLCGPALLGACSKSDTATEQDISSSGKVAEIKARGTLLVATTGDYRPLSFRESDGTYWGFGIEVAKEIARGLDVGIAFVQTSWPTLSADVLAEPQTFDLAIGGITITDARKETMQMSEGYLANGKTILCRTAEADRYRSLSDIDQPGVKVMVNPGGLNEKFARQNLSKATILVHPQNEEIPSLIAKGEADIMITEVVEANHYVRLDKRLAAPMVDRPFTIHSCGALMMKGDQEFLNYINFVFAELRADGTMAKLEEKYLK